ncbi:MAG: hypothetical protein LBH29_02695 [Elusimicrobiota bacterium]|jgi:uncharacterized Zn-finger protein|nr:hypothetical protein [Elusimicrobiota bacterium]
MDIKGKENRCSCSYCGAELENACFESHICKPCRINEDSGKKVCAECGAVYDAQYKICPSCQKS